MLAAVSLVRWSIGLDIKGLEGPTCERLVHVITSFLLNTSSRKDCPKYLITNVEISEQNHTFLSIFTQAT